MQITICDICGTRKNVKKQSYAYDRQADAAGSMDDLYETFDICPVCEAKVLRAAIKWLLKETKTSVYSLNYEIINIIRKMTNK